MTGQVQLTYQKLGACLIVRVAGEIDLRGARVLRDDLVGKVSAGDARLVVDLTRVVTFDSAGLPALLAAQHEAEASGGSLRLVGVGASIRKVLCASDKSDALVVDREMSDALEASMQAAGSAGDRRRDTW